MADRTCSIEDCEQQTYARSFCRPHYGRARYAGELPPKHEYRRRPADAVCEVPECDMSWYATGLCRTHYARKRKYGSTELPIRPVKQKAPCAIEGCASPSDRRGWCKNHYTRWWKYGDPLVVRQASPYRDQSCLINGCTRRAKSQGRCNTHYVRWIRHGKVDVAPLDAEGDRSCAVCGVDISHRRGTAIRCVDCKRRPILTQADLSGTCQRCGTGFQMQRRGKNRKNCPACSLLPRVPEGPCKFPGCEKPIKYRELCSGHAEQRRSGLPLTVLRRSAYAATDCCAFRACRKKVRVNGYCWGHAEQESRGLELTILRTRLPSNSSSIRDELGRKKCQRCQQWKEESAYSSGTKGDMLAGACRDCTRTRRLERYFNLTAERYDAILAEQGGGCAICGTTSDGSRMLSVDHDHSCCPEKLRSCGRCVRGLLCGACNTAIGLLADDASRMRRAAQYVSGGTNAWRVGVRSTQTPAAS